MTRSQLPVGGPASRVEFDRGLQGKRLLRPLNLLETGAVNFDPQRRVSGFFYLKVGQPLPLLVTGLGVYRLV